MGTKATITAAVLLYMVAAVSAANDTLNFIDPNGKRQGHWVITNETKHLENYPPQAKVEEGKYRDSKKTDVWKLYFPSGKLKAKITFEGNNPVGLAITYYENGVVMEKGTWTRNQKWIGAFEMNYEDGTPMQRWNFDENGKRAGKQQYFWPNGKIMIEGTWDNGSEKGVVTRFYEDGSKESEMSYVNGQLDTTSIKRYPMPKNLVKQETRELPVAPIGVAPISEPVDEREVDIKDGDFAKGNKMWDGNGNHIVYNKNEAIDRKGLFVNYRLIDGEQYNYDSNGRLKNIAVYKNGRYAGNGVMPEEKK